MVARELQGVIGGEIIELSGERLRNPAAEVLEVPDRTPQTLPEIAPGLKVPEKEDVVWVFPIYAWSVPPVVANFIRRCRMKGAHQARHFLLCTCGDDIGRADDVWRNLVGRRGWLPRSVFSVEMLYVYVCLKGFDVDPAEVEARKLAAMPARVREFVAKMRTAPAESWVVRGSWPWSKTHIVFPIFRGFLMSPEPFRASDACITCGLCARECPMDNIEMRDGRPAWGKNCAMCLRCYHRCPVQAISYEAATDGKGHYACPGLKND